MKRAIGMSSNPPTATSPGTRTPSSWNALRRPIAIESFAAKTAVGRGRIPSATDAARKPDSSPKSPGTSSARAVSPPTSRIASR